jgi:glycosyltransferase involved in cell wall biosynthesis
MRIALVADVFPPLRSSGAVQLRDLSRELVRQGHELVVLVPAAGLTTPWAVEEDGAMTIVRLRAPRTKDRGYLARTLAEFLMPYRMWRNFRLSPIGRGSAAGPAFEGIVWYSPSIFLGPIVRRLKRANDTPAYLIIRDVFPQWAADMGLMSRGLAFQILDAVARYQYAQANVIGVQTAGNRQFFARWERHPGRRLEVLHNWLAPAKEHTCSIDLSRTVLAGRQVLVYAGNMGVAQGMDRMLGLASAMKDDPNVGFLFVGRGSEAVRLAAEAKARGLDNTLFHDEIDPDEIPALYAQCAIGLVCLDLRHRTHNIPGKFLTYMQAGLPVLASVNPGNDLIDLIAHERVGETSTAADGHDLPEKARALLTCDRSARSRITERCRILSERLFSSEIAVKQIVAALRS